MLGGIIFVIVVWFIPILIWYFVQGKKEFNKYSSCETQSKEIRQSKMMFYSALGFGLLIIVLILLLA